MSEVRIINPKDKPPRVEVNGLTVPWPSVGQDLVIRVSQTKFKNYIENNKDNEAV